MRELFYRIIMDFVKHFQDHTIIDDESAIKVDVMFDDIWVNIINYEKIPYVDPYEHCIRIAATIGFSISANKSMHEYWSRIQSRTTKYTAIA
jgi:hypothetical protein